MMSGSLMPDPALYCLLIPYLTPASYVAALRADKQLWLRAHRPGTYGLPSPAAVFAARLQRALIREFMYRKDVVRELLLLVQQRKIWLSGTICLAILNGDPFMATTLYSLDIMYVPMPIVYAPGEDSWFEEDELFGENYPRKPRYVAPPLFDMLEKHPDWVRDCRHRALIQMEELAFYYGYLRLGSVPLRLDMRWFGCARERMMALDFGYFAIALTGERLVVLDLEAVVSRACTISTAYLASHAVARTLDREHDFGDVKDQILDLQTTGTVHGYHLALHHDANQQPRFPPMNDLKFSISTPKEVMGRFHPIECPYTTECDCYKRRYGFIPKQTCMSLHDKCQCDAHKAWPALVLRTWHEQKTIEHTRLWMTMWEENDVALRMGVEPPVKRLCFDAAE